MVEICAAHLGQVPDRPSARLGASVPTDLEDLLLALLAKQVADRPPSAAVVAQRLESCGCFGSWSQADARSWWHEHGPELRARYRVGTAPGTDDTAALTVDMRERARS